MTRRTEACKEIRAALCWTTPEIVQLAKEHNDANIAKLPARFNFITASVWIMVKNLLNTSLKVVRL